MSLPAPPKVKKLSPTKQRRLDQLLEQHAEGRITSKYKATLESLVAEAETLMVANAQRLADFARQQSSQIPGGAIPVTVWVNPALTEK